MKETEYSLDGCHTIKFLSHFCIWLRFPSPAKSLSLIFGGFVWLVFFLVGSVQSFTVIVSWFVLTVTLGEFLCTRAKRAGTNECVSNFWLQIALSKTPHFWAVGFWGKTRLFMTERITCALIGHRVHPWFYRVTSKAICITMTCYILPNSWCAAVMFCWY